MPPVADQIIPAVKIYRKQKGFFNPAAAREVVVPARFFGIESHLRRTLNMISVKARIEKYGGTRLVIGNKAGGRRSLGQVARSHAEWYELSITPQGIALGALSERALFLGLKTLEQLFIAHGQKLPCAEIVDYPDIPMRGYHVDLKAGFVNLEKLKELVKQLAAWKINTLLIEYEDRFPYKCLAEITPPGTPTLQEWAGFLKYCRSMYFTVIPLVQTHGHLDFVLRHKKFAGLREDDNTNEICPSNPRAVALVKTMLGEILPLHAQDKYFHIGADETWRLGTCPKCRARLKKETKLDLYCDHVLKIYKQLKNNEKQVLMWCDMFWRGNSPEKIKRLPKDIILCEWIYDCPTSVGSPSMYWNGKFLYSKKYAENNPAENIPEEAYIENAELKARNFAKKYLKPEPKSGVGTLSPYYKYFDMLGYDMFGVGAARCAQGGWLFGQNNMISRFDNLGNWADFIKKNRGRCLIISSWSRSGGNLAPYSPWESARDAVAAGAFFAWNAGRSLGDFALAAANAIYGSKDVAALENIYRFMGVHNTFVLKNLARFEKTAQRAKDHLKLLKLWCEFDMFRDNAVRQLLDQERTLSSIRRGRYPPKGHRSIQALLGENERLNVSIKAWRKRLAAELGTCFCAADLAEYVDARIDNLEFRLLNLKHFLRNKNKQADSCRA